MASGPFGTPSGHLNKMTGSGGEGDGGFFSSVGSALTQGISKIGSEVLPNWVDNQVNRQSKDQLNRDTFNRQESPARLGGYYQTTGQQTTASSAEYQQSGGFIENLSMNTALLILAGFAGVMFLINK